MKWSKLKSRIENTFADSIKNKIKIYNTVYRKSYDASVLSKTWITIEKELIANFCDLNSEKNFGALYHEYTPTICLKHKSIKNEDRDKSKILEEGEFSSLDFKIMAFKYLNTSAHDCLKAKHPLLRVLGILNKKVGKNKVKDMTKDEHPLVSYFAQYRFQEESNYK